MGRFQLKLRFEQLDEMKIIHSLIFIKMGVHDLFYLNIYYFMKILFCFII